jgi:2-polyprenyl-3-methyl-5-hydroxy-6-metoxy-1,4-benzoquinol methylase
MNIIDATLKIKKHIYNSNASILKLGDEFELSSSAISYAFSHNMVKSVKDYHKKTTKLGIGGGCHALIDEQLVTHRRMPSEFFEEKYFEKNIPENFNTKEYWQFLNQEFKFCDVMSYPIYPNLDNYFGIKGKLYDADIKLCGGIEIFKNKKILEIGPGYGYLPKILKENNIVCKYYCADIVKRFEHDNFIELDGYNLIPYITEKFDIIVMFDVFQHLGYTTIEAYFEEFKQILTPEGKILINTPILNENAYSANIFFAQTYYMPSENKFKEILGDNEFSFEQLNLFMFDQRRLKNFIDCHVYIIKNNGI